MPKPSFFLIAMAGGACGSLLRFLLGMANTHILPYAPFLSTLTVNVFGCLIIGYFFMFVNLKKHPHLEVFMIVGFCGGFTTYSSFMLDSYLLIMQKHFELFACYFIASIALCFMCVYIGALAGHLIHREY